MAIRDNYLVGPLPKEGADSRILQAPEGHLEDSILMLRLDYSTIL